MANTERNVAVGVFQDRAQAEKAVAELERAGFTDEHVGYAAPGEGGALETGGVDTTDAGPGVAGGIISGGVIGGIIGAAAALLLPGIGPVLAGGILASVLGGAMVGAAAGGILGALTHIGVPEEEARYYENEFRAGRPIVTVRANGRFQEASDILRRNGAYDVESGGGSTEAGAGTSTRGSATTDERTTTTETSDVSATGAAMAASAGAGGMGGSAGAAGVGPAASLGAAVMGTGANYEAAARTGDDAGVTLQTLDTEARSTAGDAAAGVERAGREAVDDVGDVAQGAADAAGAHGVARDIDRATENDPNRRG